MPPQPRATILIMEDDAVVRRSMAAYLEDREFDVLQAENGKVGLQMFHDKNPDLVLVDLRMPEMDGLEVLTKVSKTAPDNPIIVVSGTGVIADAVEALHLGAWDYVLKPIEDMEILLHAVEKALERARLKQQDREYQEQLEKDVMQRTAELEAANKSLVKEIAERRQAQKEREELIVNLESQNAELERFTYTVSHDLKTPLVTIKWLLGSLKEDVTEKDTGEILENIERIGDAADTVLRLLADLLELSRIGRVVNPPKQVSMVDVANEALATLAGQIAEKHAQIEVSPQLPMVYGDRSRLGEVVQNLIENAVRYMGDQPDPRVTIGVRTEGDDTVCFVKDNGLGIDPQFHDKIFGLFDRLDKESEGNGVGLALVKRIVEVHGGRLWVESAGAARGSTFCFTLPTREAMSYEL